MLISPSLLSLNFSNYFWCGPLSFAIYRCDYEDDDDDDDDDIDDDDDDDDDIDDDDDEGGDSDIDIWQVGFRMSAELDLDVFSQVQGLDLHCSPFGISRYATT